MQFRELVFNSRPFHISINRFYQTTNRLHWYILLTGLYRFKGKVFNSGNVSLKTQFVMVAPHCGLRGRKPLDYHTKKTVYISRIVTHCIYTHTWVKQPLSLANQLMCLPIQLCPLTFCGLFAFLRNIIHASNRLCTATENELMNCLHAQLASFRPQDVHHPSVG